MLVQRYLMKIMNGFLARIKLKYVVAAVSLVFILDFFGAFTHVLETNYDSNFLYPLDININEVLDYMHNGQTPPVQPINRYPYRFKIANEEKCKNSSNEKGHKNIVLLFLIKSAIGHKPQRNAIRHSWGFEGRFSDVEIRTVFLLGTDASDTTTQDLIDDENQEHHDIVQADFADTYFNNTIKTIMGYKWVVTHCSKTQFIFLVDDDMYVSTKNLLKFVRNPLNLQMVAPRNKLEGMLSERKGVGGVWWGSEESNMRRVYDGRLYAGYVFFSSPQRHKSSKWYISLNEYPFSMYPPYVTAGAVSLSYPALLDMYYASLYTKHFRFDDIYMGILAKKTGIHPIHNDNVFFWKKTYTPTSYANVIASHGYGNPRELVKVWEEQKSLGNA